MHYSTNNSKGSVMVVVLTLVLTFAMIGIALNELVVQQSLELEYMGARVQADYASLSGLIHGQVSLAEDVSTNFTITPETIAEFRKIWCVEWFVNESLKVCNTSASPDSYCCAYQGGQCKTRPQNGVCESENRWVLKYTSRYDSIEKAIVSSGSIEFVNDDLETLQNFREPVRFISGRQMGLNWE
ncbi:MAG: hypothetical protein H3C47_02380 [Candidatus Cloacimonetes bacterium]|nr:hypothetical protein [Candidatus Cloacimonadota bacterium]